MNLDIKKSQYELERGKPTPTKNHSIIQSRIGKFVSENYENRFEILPELTLLINEKSITPDLIFYNFDNILIDFDDEDEISVSQIPLGVVEIMSPTQTITELIVKSHAFFDAGVKSYWLVIPSLKTIYVFSDKGEYEVYAKTDKLIDNQLNIEMDLGKLFSKK